MAKTLGGKVFGLALRAVRLPISTTAKSVNLATGAGLAGFRLLQKRSAQARQGQVTVTQDSSKDNTVASSGVSSSDASSSEAPAEDTAEPPAQAPAEDAETPPLNPNEAAVDMLPYPTLEEPVPIVEQVLAEEETTPPQVGHATEPSAASRDEAHGDAHLQRAEAEEISEEVAEAFPGGDLDIETPVGTTGADVAHNPDTAEADLQQPGTEPLMDPGLTKAVKSETERGRRAADAS